MSSPSLPISSLHMLRSWSQTSTSSSSFLPLTCSRPLMSSSASSSHLSHSSLSALSSPLIFSHFSISPPLPSFSSPSPSPLPSFPQRSFSFSPSPPLLAKVSIKDPTKDKKKAAPPSAALKAAADAKKEEEEKKKAAKRAAKPPAPLRLTLHGIVQLIKNPDGTDNILSATPVDENYIPPHTTPTTMLYPHHHGLGLKFYRRSWVRFPEPSYVTITKYIAGKYPKAWGILTWRGVPASHPRPIAGQYKPDWKYLEDPEKPYRIDFPKTKYKFPEKKVRVQEEGSANTSSTPGATTSVTPTATATATVTAAQ